MKKVAVVSALLLASAIIPRAGQSQPVVRTPPTVVPLKNAQLVPFQGTTTFPSIADLDGQLIGAGPNVVALLADDGKVNKTFPTTIAKPAISPHGASGILIGDLTARTISTMDTKTGAVTPLFKLADVSDANPAGVPSGRLLVDGAFSAVASDGKLTYVAVDAGFSSSIFKIDPATKKIVGRAWASGPEPTSMAFVNGGLFVLVAGSQVRRFTDTLDRSKDNIELGTTDVDSIAVRKTGEIKAVDVKRKGFIPVKVDASELQVQTIKKNLDRVQLTNPKIRAVPGLKLSTISKKYAVLISGDLAENFAGECFWNDTVWMYKALLQKGYAPEDVFVLYGDGADYASANPKYRHPAVVTDYAATSANVNIVLDGLKNGDSGRGIPKMDSNDTLFVWTFDHGGRSGSESTLCLRDGCVPAPQINAKLNAINYGSRSVFMQQCYSGGFIPGLKNAKTFISTAASASQLAYPADTENETYNGKTYSHGEYNYWAITAMTETAAANSNSDAFISTKEMHQWVVAKESRSETPQMDDTGGIGSTFKFTKP